MAEQVQAVLDQMVAPLRDLMDRGIFSESEIRSIVSRRREYEYLLRRRAARKADFLRYIQDEMTLEKLRAIRTRQVLQRQARVEKDKPMNNKKKQHHIGDTHVVAHIHFLFTRMLRKFRSDVSLHLQHAAFSKEAKSFTRLGKIYAEALQVHPRNVGLWIEAASHEFFGHMDRGQRVGGGSVQSARVILQRGLRVNPRSQDLWLQYFCLEFHHIQKLRGRREILQLDQHKQHDDNDAPPDETDPLFHEAPIPTVVYNNAIKAIPDNVTFRLKFLDMLRLFPQTDAVETVIMSSIERDFQDKPEAWIARATYAVEQIRKQHMITDGETETAVGFTKEPSNEDNKESEDDAQHPRKKQKGNPNKSTSDATISVLQEAARQLPTPEMYLHCVQFARSYMERLAQGEIYNECESDIISKVVQEAKAFAEHLLSASCDLDATSTDLVMEHADFLVSSGRPNDAARVLENFLQTSTSEKAETVVWINLARLSEQLKPPKSAADVLRQALKQIPIHDTGHMVLLLELFSALLNQTEPPTDTEQLKRDDELSDLFQRVLLLSPGEEYRRTSEGEVNSSSSPGRSIAEIFLRYLVQMTQVGGVSAARKVYTALFQSNYFHSTRGKSQDDVVAMKEIFDQCLHLEKANGGRNPTGKGRKELKGQLRKIYDAALSFFGEVEPTLTDSYRQGRDEDVRFS